MKRLTILLLLLCLPALNAALGEVVIDFSYEVLPDKTIEVTSYTGNASMVKVPDEIDGYPVTVIGMEAFAGKTVVEVEIPEGVTKIGDISFFKCERLENIVIPDTVTEIGDSAFCMSGLTRIELPDGLVKIGDSAFSNTSLDEIRLPKTLTRIGEYAFCNTLLEEVEIPAGVRILEEGAFSLTPLRRVTLHEGLRSIGTGVFYGCASLTEAEIPESVTNISDNAFYGCTQLETTMPAGATVSGGAGSERELTVIEPEAPEETAAPEDPLAVFATSELSDGTLTITAYTGEASLVEIPESIDGKAVTEIGDAAFAFCAVESVTIPEGIRRIGEQAFYGCLNLVVVDLPDSIEEVGEDAFYSSGVMDVTLSEALDEAAYEGAFEEHVRINGVSKDEPAPEPTEEAPEVSPFRYAGSSDGTASIIGYVGEVDALEIPAVSDGWVITSIAEGAFSGGSFVKVVIADGIETIDEGAFRACTALAEVVLPNTLKSIGKNAFEGCTALAGITLPEGLESIGKKAFQSCASLREITIPESVTELGMGAFVYCPALQYAYLPEHIPDGDVSYAFEGNVTIVRGKKSEPTQMPEAKPEPTAKPEKPKPTPARQGAVAPPEGFAPIPDSL